MAVFKPDYLPFTFTFAFSVLSGVYTFDPMDPFSLALSKARIFSSLIRSVSAMT